MSHPPVVFVDEDDQVLGAASLSEVREKGQIHRIARVMLEDKDGNILLQKRAPTVAWPNIWDHSAAGHVDEGENYDQAALREMLEEIGVKTKLTRVGKYYSENLYQKQVIKRFNAVYKAVVEHDVKTILQPEEVSEVRWFTLVEIRNLIQNQPEQFTDGIHEVIARYYS